MSDFKNELKKDYEKYIDVYRKLDEKIAEYELEIEKIDNGEVNYYDKGERHSTTNIDREKEKYNKEKRNGYINKKKHIEDWKKSIFTRKIKTKKETIYIITDSDVGNTEVIDGWFLSRLNEKYIELSKIEIGDKFAKLGTVELVGKYKPNEDNLLNVEYENTNGKGSFKDAKYALGIIVNDAKVIDTKIDISNFFRLKFELAEQGLQSRALYSQNSSIIDGAAGTGKSTIAIQKLEYYHKKLDIPQNKMLIIVKNEDLKEHFKSLLEDEHLNLKEIDIYLSNEIIDSNDINEKLLIQCKNRSIEIVSNITIFSKTFNEETVEQHQKNSFNHMGKEIIIKHLSELIKINHSQYDRLTQELNLVEKKLSDETMPEIINVLQNKKLNLEVEIRKFDNKKYQKALQSLDKNERLSSGILKELMEENINNINADNYKVLLLLQKYKDYYLGIRKNRERLQDVIIKIGNSTNDIEMQKLKNKKLELEKKISTVFKLDKNQIEKIHTKLKNMYLSEVYITNQYLSTLSLYEKDLILKYILKEKKYNTIIIDEGQDYTKVEIELIRLLTERVIITGDILQNTSNNEINQWSNILNFQKIFKTENLYTLKHNFRQTYQLANASFNFRQLLLGKDFENIESDYYEDEKKLNGKLFPKPKIVYTQEIKNYIIQKIDNLTTIYSSSFPITIIYKSEEFKNLFDDIKNLKFVQFKNIKGEQYPVIISEYNDELLDKEIYLILSRGQFEVEFISATMDINNNFLNLLYREQIIEKDSINFKASQPIEENKKYNLEHLQFKPEIKKDDRSKLEKKNSNQNIKIRVHEIAKELNLNSKDVVKKAKEIGLNVKSANSSLSVKEAENFKNHIRNSEQQEDEDKKALTTKQSIEKHAAETNQWQEDIDPDIIIDEEQYKKNFIKKVSEDIQNYEASSKQQEIIILKKTNITDNEQKNKIKIFLANTYKGYCQICGFTFRKVADGQKSFEMYSWNDKRVVKKKKSFISTADSLSLCRNCSANIKWGAFEPTFLEHIKNIQNFETATIEDIKKEIHKAVDENLPDIFEGYLNFNDMYALEIKLNDEAKNIYFTDIHLVQFIAYLQLENR